MVSITRPEKPECLSHVSNSREWGTVSNEDKWGLDYQARRSQNPSAVFNWPTYQGRRINTILEPILRDMTHNHCSFCDIWPVRKAGATIEHFKPKATFNLDVCRWENLFYCCGSCQKAKQEQFDELLLKPDELSYTFERYFIVDSFSFEIIPNPGATTEDQERARISIKLYGLNEYGCPEARKAEFEKVKQGTDPNICSFRYLFN